MDAPIKHSLFNKYDLKILRYEVCYSPCSLCYVKNIIMNIYKNLLRDHLARNKYARSETIRRNYTYLKLNASRIGYVPIKTLPKSTIRSYCLVSGASRSIYRKSLRLSRHSIKKNFAFLKGLRASSW